ncbi:TerB family tellurite resistance protein [Streptomyces sp. NPDC007088]|uniref:TerB family tellurite resistance protein n=1 Tax=Streptomyces sp. NPDC007088 TaxID=3364773 RepID=UPI0036B524AF
MRWAVRTGARIAHVRTSWTTVGDGEFFCPDCGGDRNYLRRTGRRRLTFLGVPVLGRGRTGPVVECGSCEGRFGPEVLDHPTTHRFGALLRDAVHTVVVAVLAAGGTASRTTMETAAATVRAAGFEDCGEDQLYMLMRALSEDPGSAACPDDPAEAETAALTLAIELHESIDPLAPHLAPVGRETILLQGARVALADGPYTAAERDALELVGTALTLDADEVTRLLEEARMPS